MSEQRSAEGEARREIEDLWWFRHCIKHLVEHADINGAIRVGVLRSVLETTRPLTSSTDPRTDSSDPR